VGRLPLHYIDERPDRNSTKHPRNFSSTKGEKGVKLSGDSSLMCAALAHTFAAAGKGTQAIENPA